jgi:dTDP-glucose 4,6-dehydratase
MCDRVLITGAGGFIGSHLVEELVRRGAKVRAFVRYKSDGSWGWLDTLPCKDEIEVIAGDICDIESVKKAVTGCNKVFHLSALISIPYSYEAPRSYVKTNMEGTLNMLQASLDTGVERFIHTSTSEVYGTPETVPITETHPLKGQSPYSASKIGADKIAESYYYSFNLPVTILRPFNTYGPRQTTRAVLPTILTQLLSGSKEIRLGSLTPRRDMTYVSDTVDGFIKAASSKEALGQTVQLGTGRDISIGEMATMAMSLLGFKVDIVTEEKRVRPSKSEVQRLLSKPEKAKRLMGWEPYVNLEEGIARTADWLRKNMALYRSSRYLI